jgi:hypothetical protein
MPETNGLRQLCCGAGNDCAALPEIFAFYRSPLCKKLRSWLYRIPPMLLVGPPGPGAPETDPPETGPPGPICGALFEGPTELD